MAIHALHEDLLGNAALALASNDRTPAKEILTVTGPNKPLRPPLIPCSIRIARHQTSLHDGLQSATTAAGIMATATAGFGDVATELREAGTREPETLGLVIMVVPRNATYGR